MLALLPGIVNAQAADVPERKSVSNLTPSELMSLRRGVAVMMSRNSATRNSANFRRSWVYWANMHSHFGSDCAGAKKGAGMTSVKTWTASNANERATWCQCEHGTTQFLTWHRMYLYYFEQVLQQAAGDTTLRLPFWDYSADPLLPEAYRATTYVNEQGQTVSNPLRVANRRATLNSGSAGLSSSVSSSANAMGATAYEDFSARLEQGPHGPVHCAIGQSGCPTGLMGSIPASALDPIFYVHHANIDRIYECWLRVNESARLPQDAATLDRAYTFVRGDGKLVTRKVRDMLTLDQIDVRYAQGDGCPADYQGYSSLVVAQASETQLGSGVTTMQMSVEPAAAARAQSAQAAAPRKTVTVVIEGLTAAKVPGVLYEVFLTNADGQRSLLGVIDFFGFEATGDANSGNIHHHGGAASANTGRTYRFDATAAVAKLGLRTNSTPQLEFIPTTGLTDSTPEQAARAVPAGADVRFKRARMRVGPAS